MGSTRGVLGENVSRTRTSGYATNYETIRMPYDQVRYLLSSSLVDTSATLEDGESLRPLICGICRPPESLDKNDDEWPFFGLSQVHPRSEAIYTF